MKNIYYYLNTENYYLINHTNKALNVGHQFTMLTQYHESTNCKINF